MLKKNKSNDENLYIERYKNKLASYGIYCKEEEQENWLRSCQGLISTGKDLNEKEWAYETYVFESTCEILKELGENKSWEEIENNFFYHFNDMNIIQDITEMVLVYSPKGINFVDEVIKPNFYLKELGRAGQIYIAQKAKQLYKENHQVQKKK